MVLRRHLDGNNHGRIKPKPNLLVTSTPARDALRLRLLSSSSAGAFRSFSESVSESTVSIEFRLFGKLDFFVVELRISCGRIEVRDSCLRFTDYSSRLKCGASSRWSFRPNSAWSSIETMVNDHW